MPNFDTGHYFLTTLAPIKTGTTKSLLGDKISFKQDLRTILSLLPTASQSSATEMINHDSDRCSPFSRNLRTHFCRFMILDDVIYNGRVGKNPIVSAVKNENLLIPEEIDHLNCSYLMFVADIDAVLNDGDPLPKNLSQQEQDAVREAYAHQLWKTMKFEIQKIYSNCVGFDRVKDAKGFANYLRRCQIETTMPFNDYWLNPPEFDPLPVKKLVTLVLTPFVITLLGLVGWIFQMEQVPILHWFFNWTPSWTFLGGFVATSLTILAALFYTLKYGNRPFPAGKYADLPSVLKSLLVQQTFSNFVVASQGKSDAELHQAFGEFLAKQKPSDKRSPRQAPGVISIKAEKAVLAEKNNT